MRKPNNSRGKSLELIVTANGELALKASPLVQDEYGNPVKDMPINGFPIMGVAEMQEQSLETLWLTNY